jgi:two-component system, OmpR family, sensor histidine kinase VicK
VARQTNLCGVEGYVLDAVIDETALLAAIVRGSDDAIFAKDTTGRILSWNRGAEELYGYTAAEAIGQPVGMLVPASLRGEDQRILERMAAGERIDHFESVRVRKDGTEVHVSLTISPLRDKGSGAVVGASVVARSIEDRLAADAALGRLAGIVNGSDDAIYSKDRHAVLDSWNPAATRLYGYTAEEAIGQPVSMLVPGYRRGEEIEILGRILEGASVDHYETQRVRKDGSLVDVSLTVSPVHARDGSILGASVIGRNITERRRLEAMARTHETQAAIETLRERFLATVSHELRTPLTSILGFTMTMRERWAELPDSTRLEFVAIVEEQGERLRDLVEELLMASSIARSSMVPEPQVFDAATVCRRAAHGLQMEVDTSAEGRTLALADPDMFRQAFENVLVNAHKHGAAPFVVTVQEAPASGAVEIRVRDHGGGVSSEFAPHLFKAFSQSAPGADQRANGVGLGLSIVERLLAAQGGAAWFEQPLGRGACFAMSLPAADEDAVVDLAADEIEPSRVSGS